MLITHAALARTPATTSGAGAQAAAGPSAPVFSRSELARPTRQHEHGQQALAPDRLEALLRALLQQQRVARGAEEDLMFVCVYCTESRRFA